MVLYRGSTVCVVEGWSIVEVIKVNVANIKSSVGGEVGGARVEERAETEDLLKCKKWSIKDQTVTNDVALLGNQCNGMYSGTCMSKTPPRTAHVTPPTFDHLCEASMVAGFDATIRSSPVPEAKLITVGESPMIALYKITKVVPHDYSTVRPHTLIHTPPPPHTHTHTHRMLVTSTCQR